ncbi:MAG: peptide chain release factor-like protein [Planctomycetaceae bacterium]|nr:peptide chain release factor-like protein [Planctomycetaceae bacterium]
MIHPVELSDEDLLEQCEVRRTRHSGPGGQHRNKVETAIEIRHQPTGIIAFAAERRSQEQNRKVAFTRLRLLLAVRIRTVDSAEVVPSALWQKRCVHQRIVCSEQHRDFAQMLREALDAIDAKELDVRRAAAALGCSSSQLIRFVGRVPEALDGINQQREQRGLHRLKT